MDGKSLVLNGDGIETVECTPDTVITMTHGNKYLVKETVDAVVELFKQYKQEIAQAPIEESPRSVRRFGVKK